MHDKRQGRRSKRSQEKNSRMHVHNEKIRLLLETHKQPNEMDTNNLQCNNKTKLMHGLESAQLNESINKYLDIFHLECLRRILNLEHSYLDRNNTIEKIYAETGKEMNAGNKGKHKPLIKLSEYYDTQRMKTLAQTIHLADTDDIRANITYNKETLQINEYDSKRIGRPKFAWWIHALDDMWRRHQHK